MTKKILSYAEAQNRMSNMTQLNEQRQKAELERLAVIVKMEHNYYNQVCTFFLRSLPIRPQITGDKKYLACTFKRSEFLKQVLPIILFSS